MKFKPFSGVGRLMDNKKFLIALSIVVAIIFWLVIEIAENPSRNITISDVPVTLIEKEDDSGKKLVPVGDYENKVTVIVSGPGYLVGTVSKDDITVSVKTYEELEKGPGVYMLNLNATVNKSGCTAEASPGYIQVTYDFISEAEIPVEVDVTDLKQYETTDCKLGKSVLKNTEGAELPTLSVSGPSEVVSAIAKAVVKPDLEGVTFSMVSSSFKGNMVFYDHVGQEVDASQLTYNTETYVRVVVYKTANVPLVPTFTNLPGYYSESETGSPPVTLSVYNEVTKKYETVTEITVQGPIDMVDALLETGLQLAPIDFTEVTPDNTRFNVSFVLEDGVEVVDGTEEITVSLKLGTIRTTSVTVDPSNIRFVGLGGGLTASTSYKKGINITLCGKSSVLNNIDANDITVSVDCSLITSATVEAKSITVTVNDSIEAWAIEVAPQEISVTVK